MSAVEHVKHECEWPRNFTQEVSHRKLIFFQVALQNTKGMSCELHDNRLVGLSVQGRNISGLQERVNITMNLAKDINVTTASVHRSVSKRNVCEPYRIPEKKIISIHDGM